MFDYIGNQAVDCTNDQMDHDLVTSSTLLKGQFGKLAPFTNYKTVDMLTAFLFEIMKNLMDIDAKEHEACCRVGAVDWVRMISWINLLA